MNRAEKRQIRLRILDIQDSQCKGCEKVPKKLSQDKRNGYCRQNCEIGKTLEKLGGSLIEGRTSSMAEQKTGIKFVQRLRNYVLRTKRNGHGEESLNILELRKGIYTITFREGVKRIARLKSV
nr:zinc-finger domain-containing protein [Bacillus cytotoxicus]